MGGSDSEGKGAAHPAQLSMERVAMNKALVRRRQRLREVTGDVKCKRVDIQELAEMSEDEFERIVQRMAVMVQRKKVQAEAATAALKLQPSSMD